MNKLNVKASVLLLALLPLFASAQTETIQVDVEFPTDKGSEYKEVTLTVVGNEAYFEDDIFVGYVDESGQLVDSEAMLSKNASGSVGTQSVVVASPSLRWPYGVVPYTMSDYFPSSQTHTAISNAMAHIEANSGVKFIPRNGHTNYVQFVPHSKCASPIGMQGGRQTIKLGEHCQTTKTHHVSAIVHEILHALGFYHMQSRADRDNYITVNYDNIVDDREHNFDKLSFSDPSVVHMGNYDLTSIMHYHQFTTDPTFVHDINVPMFTVNSGPGTQVSGYTLSNTDIASLQEIYGAIPATSLSGIPAMCRGRAQLEWDPVSGADEYVLERDLGVPGQWTEYTTTSSTSATVNLSTSGQMRVTACTTSGACSLPSNTFYVHYYSPCL